MPEHLVDVSIPAMVQRSAERFGDAPAVVDGDTTLSFRDVADEMLAVARGLVANGIEAGDRVVVWAPNSARWITTALGVLAVGGCLVPLNTRFKGPEAAFVLRKTEASMLVCVNGFLGVDYVGMVTDADPQLRALDKVVVLDGDVPPGAMSWDDLVAGGEAVDPSVVQSRIDAIGPDDMSDIIFTSGTTGTPKGVVLRHGPSLRVYHNLNEGLDLHEGDRILIVLPFFHTFGYKSGWMIALMFGATSVPLPVFDPGETLRVIEQQRITHLGGSPTIFGALLDHPARATTDFSAFKVGLVSAAYVPLELVNRMIDDMGMDHAMTGYGMTETHGVVGFTYPDDPREVVATWSCKGSIPGSELRIVDDDGNDVPVGERGEVLFRGFNLTTEYFNEPEATASAIDADGWLHTGDVAYMSPEGYIKICDRKKEMLITGGFNVAPAEVEGMLCDWDRVAAAAIVATPDDRLGEVGVAFVIPANGTTLSPDEVITHARSVMANYKVPRRVEIVDELPLNATGKVLKNELRAKLAEAG